MNIPENILSKLTDEQKKKVEAVQSPEELLACAKEARSGYIFGAAGSHQRRKSKLVRKFRLFS